LHVLSTPPAFVLSQDQTLRQRSSRSFDASTEADTAKASLSSGIDALADIDCSPSPRASSRRWVVPGVNLAPLFWLIRSPDVPSTVVEAATTGTNPLRSPLLTGHEALAFHTLLSFQGASWDRPCDSPDGSPSRSRRRSGGHLTVGLPSSSTEHPIPWFRRGCPHFRLVRPGSEEAPERRHVTGLTVENVGRPVGIPQGIAALTSNRTSPRRATSRAGRLGPLARPRHQHFTQKRRPVPLGSGRPPKPLELRPSGCR
jgi:hypothetical protein